MSEHMDDLRTKIARLIDPSSWRVMDSYLAQMQRQHRGVDGAYDPDAFKDKASLSKADAILALPELKGVGKEDQGSDGAPLQPPGSGREDAPSSGSIFIVHGSTGEYSDRFEWVVRAHPTEAAARADVEHLTTKLAELVGGAVSVPYEERDAIADKMRVYDPCFYLDYTGTSWFVRECPLADGALGRHVETAPQQRSEPPPSIPDTPLGGWRPIETAPKDGAELIGYRPDQGVFVFRWAWMEEFVPRDRNGDPVEEYDDTLQGWWHEVWGWMHGVETPTHWQPLPAPPEQSGEA